MYSEITMKRIAFAFLITGSLFVFTNCGSSPSDAPNQNTNAVSVNETAPSPAQPSPANVATPQAETSPAQDGRLSEANYPQIAQEIHRRINAFRESQGLEPLALNPLISEQARLHSVEMSQTPNTISHKNFDERIAELRKQLPYQGSAENVAANLNYKNPGVEAAEGWINSPSHRKNILGDYNQTGIGIAQTEDGRYFFTQIFWKP